MTRRAQKENTRAANGCLAMRLNRRSRGLQENALLPQRAAVPKRLHPWRERLSRPLQLAAWGPAFCESKILPSRQRRPLRASCQASEEARVNCSVNETPLSKRGSDCWPARCEVPAGDKGQVLRSLAASHEAPAVLPVGRSSGGVLRETTRANCGHEPIAGMKASFQDRGQNSGKKMRSESLPLKLAAHF